MFAALSLQSYRETFTAVKLHVIQGLSLQVIHINLHYNQGKKTLTSLSSGNTGIPSLHPIFWSYREIFTALRLQVIQENLYCTQSSGHTGKHLHTTVNLQVIEGNLYCTQSSDHIEKPLLHSVFRLNRETFTAFNLQVIHEALTALNLLQVIHESLDCNQSSSHTYMKALTAINL